MARSRALALTVSLALVAAFGAVSCGDDGGGPSVTVMTRNMYLGADLGSVLEAPEGANLLELIDQVWLDVVASDIPSRVGAMADEIAAAEPDLVGLQEAMRYELAGEEPVEFDFVALLLGALADRDLEYEVVAEQEQFGGAFPTSFGMVTLQDRDAIIARAGAGFDTSEPDSGRFEAAFEVPNPLGGTITVVRGWTAVDVTLDGGETFRFVNTHLEAFDEAVRLAQARELLAGPAAVDGSVVLVGDLNSPATDGPAYELVVTTGGYTDAWTEAEGDAAGLTCCWEGDLRTVDSLDTRIDLLLFEGGFVVTGADVVGDEESDRVTSTREPAGDLWPSDHAGVVATLEVPSS